MKAKPAKPPKTFKASVHLKDMKPKKDPKGKTGNGFDKLGAYGKIG